MLKRYYDIIEFIFKVTREINKTIENTEIWNVKWISSFL